MIETTGDDRTFPPALAEVARVEFEYGDDGEGVDFEPYDTFDSAEETTHWIRCWTGNQELDGDAYRVFGQDGTGGLAALWLVRPGRPLAEQPVVFLGSEGESGVAAGSLSDFLWVLADGLGPLEAAVEGERDARPDAALAELAARHATTPRRPAREIIAEAQAEFATFSEDLDALCR
ncbi:SMI1/KNR4 family protein [Streptomyces sp. CB01881]|uniref:SMI1/KNR4 family protein n=1 Tax=Streptomyces sp. CB01881 TaxID=2078691 RepID=UPI000CDCC3C9|nr:SMI1/KNR4 family protein [Streptomyces sp. CB01881]AUY48920.1 SMI1/KNR4 family protein [Streptomyces sp. CB01881]TYC77408.1 SMI1/KNR4 family protein [Streptomyces sp. CB01881]